MLVRVVEWSFYKVVYLFEMVRKLYLNKEIIKSIFFRYKKVWFIYLEFGFF